MDDQKIYLVGGIAFTDIKQAKIAQIEQKRIEVLDNKLNYNDIDAVANVYKKARDNRTFQTPVGINYMMRLYHWLKNNDYEGIDKMYVVIDMEAPKTQTDNLDKSVHVEHDNVWKSRMQAERHKRKEVSERLRISLIVNVVLVVLVILLFVISQTGSNPTILNYKTKIINQYTSWEQELEQREKIVEEKEAQLGITVVPGSP